MVFINAIADIQAYIIELVMVNEYERNLYNGGV